MTVRTRLKALEGEQVPDYRYPFIISLNSGESNEVAVQRVFAEKGFVGEPAKLGESADDVARRILVENGIELHEEKDPFLVFVLPPSDPTSKPESDGGQEFAAGWGCP